MQKGNRQILFVDSVSKPKALVFGFNGFLFEALVGLLSKYGCNIVTLEKDFNKHNFSYIFHKDNLQKISRTLYLAQKNHAKFIFLSSKENAKNKDRIIHLLEKIKADVEVFIFSYPEPESLEQAILNVRSIFNDVFINERKKVVAKSKNKFPRNPRQNIRPTSLLFKTSLVLIIMVLGLGIYIGGIVGSFYLAIRKLNTVQHSLLSGNISLAKTDSDKAYKLFTFAKKLLAIPLPLLKTIDYNDAATLEQSFEIGELFSKTVSQASYTAQLAQTIGESIISSRTALHKSQLEQLDQEVQQLNINVQSLLAQVKALERNNSQLSRFFNIDKQLKQGENSLGQLSELLSLTSRFSTILPNILGYEKPKTFLLLFQNNTELRPTGGFIGSFGWVTFSQGRLIEFKTEDVYTADGQLKGHVPPPEPLKKYLSLENWYLRDSNFDPDFTLSATQAEWFLRHEMNLAFDGVFAIDLHAVQELLRGMDGVFLTDYQEAITADNLFFKTQSASEMGFFPGSTQKKDFIGSLARSIFIKLTSSRISWPKMITGVKSSLDQKHALLYFHNDSAQQLVEQAGWGGRIGAVSCKESSCLADFLMIVEANLGINKANFLVNRNAELTISSTASSLVHDLKINYTNESSDSVFPGGAYFSYTRVLIPKEASVSEIVLGKEKLKAEDITIEEYQDKLSVGFPLRVGGSGKETVKLTYSLPVTDKISAIELLVQKQPGITSFPLQVTVVAGSEESVQQLEVNSDHLLSLSL